MASSSSLDSTGLQASFYGWSVVWVDIPMSTDWIASIADAGFLTDSAHILRGWDETMDHILLYQGIIDYYYDTLNLRMDI